MATIDRVFILHLTDLHIGEHFKNAESEAAFHIKLENFYTFLRTFKSERRNDDKIHVAITGDFIYNFGSWDNDAPDDDRDKKLTTFKTFLETVSKCLGIPNNNFIFCYGNHDKSRDLYNQMLREKKLETFNKVSSLPKHKAREVFKTTPRENLDHQIISEVILESTRSTTTPMFINAYEFLDGCAVPILNDENCHLTGVKTIDNINYISINSSWLCGEYTGKINDKGIPESFPDNGSLSLGFQMIKELINTAKARPATFNVGLIHHHVNSLHFTNYLPKSIEDTDPLWSDLVKACDIILVGHEHGELAPYMAENSSYIYRSGTFLSKDDLKGYNTFNVLEVNFEYEKVNKLTYRFDHSGQIESFDKYDSDLVFPKKAQEGFVSHKIVVNDYFLIQQKRFSKIIQNLQFIPAEDFLHPNFDINYYPNVLTICDAQSFQGSNTLTEYLELHSSVRSAVLQKLIKNVSYSSLTWTEPLELLI